MRLRVEAGAAHRTSVKVITVHHGVRRVPARAQPGLPRAVRHARRVRSSWPSSGCASARRSSGWHGRCGSTPTSGSCAATRVRVIVALVLGALVGGRRWSRGGCCSRRRRRSGGDRPAQPPQRAGGHRQPRPGPAGRRPVRTHDRRLARPHAAQPGPATSTCSSPICDCRAVDRAAHGAEGAAGAVRPPPAGASSGAVGGGLDFGPPFTVARWRWRSALPSSYPT